MVGIDLCKISRFKDDAKTINKFLSNEEKFILNKIKNQKKRLEFIASRFSAKESIFKALSEKLTYIPFTEISILNKENGAPYVIYKNYDFGISITHEEDFVSTIVILKNII